MPTNETDLLREYLRVLERLAVYEPDYVPAGASMSIGESIAKRAQVLETLEALDESCRPARTI